MGEKQIEVDRRLLKGRMARLRKDIEEARGRRQRDPYQCMLCVEPPCRLPPAASCWRVLAGLFQGARWQALVALSFCSPEWQRPCTARARHHSAALHALPAGAACHWRQCTHIGDCLLPCWRAVQVRTHRRAYRERRAAAPIPVVALVGYTNAGKLAGALGHPCRHLMSRHAGTPLGGV